MIFKNIILLFLISHFAFSQDESNILNNESFKYFSDVISKEWIEAEQNLSKSTPFFSNIRNPLGLVVPMAKHHGNLADTYQPHNNKVFELITIYVDINEVNIFGNLADSPSELTKVIDGKIYVKMFIHPSQKDNFKNYIEAAIIDKEKFIATPSSSARSLFVKEAATNESFIIKTSMKESMGGISNRIITDEHAIRAVAISNEYKELLHETDGKLKGTKVKWDFFSEGISVIPKNTNEAGGYILRKFPESLSPNTHTILPWYALISKRDGKKTRYIDDIYQATKNANIGFKITKTDFIFKNFGKPMAEIYSMLAFDKGLTSELHQQNTLVAINRESGKVESILVRDMDAHMTDYTYRREKGITKIKGYGEFLENAERFKFNKSTEYMLGSYREPVRYHSIKSIFKYFLNDNELDAVLVKMDQHIVTRFNKVVPENFKITHINQFNTAWTKYKLSIETPIEKIEYKALNSKNAKAIPNYIMSTYNRWMEDSLNYKKRPSEMGSMCRYFFK